MGGGSTTTQDTTSNQINQIPQWMSDAGQQNYAYAQNVAQQPLQQYQGQMVADVSPQTQQSWDVAANSGNVGSDQFNAATAGYLGALGQTPASVTAGQLSNTNLQPYMNPYTQDVINATLPLMQQQNALSQNQQANAANSANAFGGSRQGIQQGVAQAQGALNIGEMAAQLNQANFAQAQAGATGDLNRTLQAQQGNQTADQAKINSDILASQGLTNTGQQMNASNVANFNMLQSAGAAQQMQAQNDINAQMAKFNQAFNYPQQQLGVLESSLGMTPHDTSTSGQSNTTTTTPTDWASIIEGGAKSAAGVFGALGASDRSLKTDITKLGKDPKTGLDMHAYRYKGDPKSYPKVVGPMAQDVEEKYPGKTERVGGKLAVSPDIMSAAGVKGYAAGTPFVGQPSLAAFTPPSSKGVAKGILAMSAFRPPTRFPRGAGVPKMQHFAGGTPYVTDARSVNASDTVPAMLTPGEAVLTPPVADHIGRNRIARLNAMMPHPGISATGSPRAGARGIHGALANTKLRPKVAGGLSG